MKRFRWVIVISVLIGGCFTVDRALHRKADPTGRASTLGEFLAWRPSAEEFALTEINGQQYVLAYGPAGRTLPSGPAGYVFGPDGTLVDWSGDIGDDPAFNDKWNAQRARGTQPLSRSEVATMAATRPAGSPRTATDHCDGPAGRTDVAIRARPGARPAVES